MKVALTGGTGLVGGAVLRELVAAGHQVTAIVRSDKSAATVTTAGATAAIGDVTDERWLTEQFSAADGAVHTASPGDATSPEFDTAVVHAALAAFGGTGKPYVHTGGVWVYGSGDAITEDSPFHAPALTAWRAGVEKLLLDDDSVRGVVVEPAIVYEGDAGLSALVTQPDEDGNVRTVGDGTQHWTTVAAGQLAQLYRLALENDQARGYYIGANGDQVTVAELAAAAVAAAGSGRVVTETADASRSRLSAPLAEALLLDQISASTRARDELRWTPTGPSLLETIAAR